MLKNLGLMLLGIVLYNMWGTLSTKYHELNNSTGGRYTLEHKGQFYTCENQRNGRYCLGKDGFQVIIEETDWRRAQLGE